METVDDDVTNIAIGEREKSGFGNHAQFSDFAPLHRSPHGPPTSSLSLRASCPCPQACASWKVHCLKKKLNQLAPIAWCGVRVGQAAKADKDTPKGGVAYRED